MSFFVSFVTGDELIERYRNARSFVYASTFEDFGIPLLQAMASGTPLASFNSTPMPEVVDPYALFQPYRR